MLTARFFRGSLVVAFVTALAAGAPAQVPAPRAPAAAPTPPGRPAPPPAQRAPAPPPAQRAPAPPPAQRAPAPPPAQAGAAAPSDPMFYAPGVVTLERAGKYLALGTILNADGRILTALNALGGAQRVDARYADGTLVPTRLGHADRERDLALLVPQNSRHKLGMRASRRPAPGTPANLRGFAPAGGRAVAGGTFTTAPSSLASADGKPLPDLLAFTAPIPPASVGSPLLDDMSEVVAVVTRACRKAAGSGCAPVLAGTPVSAVREFLLKVPASAAIPVAWIGVSGAADDAGSARGVRVMSARGPALAAGLRAGQDARSADVIVAIDGAPVTTPEALTLAVEHRAIGDSVDLLVLGAGRYRHVTLVVTAAPAAR